MKSQQQSDRGEIRKTINVSSSKNNNFLIFFTIFMLYILISVLGTTDLMLLLPKHMFKMPMINFDLNLIAFYILAPMMLFMLHFNILFSYNRYLKKIDEQHEKINMNTLDPSIYGYAYSMISRGFDGILINLFLWIWIYIIPLTVLIFIYIRFSDYHDYAITTFHLVIVLLDISLIFLSFHYNSIHLKHQQKAVAILSYLFRTLSTMIFILAGVYYLFIFRPVIDKRDPRIILNTEKENCDNYISRMKVFITDDNESITIPSSCFPRLVVNEAEMAKISHSALYLPRFLIEDDNKSKNEKERQLILDYGARSNLVGRNLRYANLYGCILTRADLTKADLQSSDLRKSHLQAAKLIHANLSHANLIGAKLDKADLKDANLTGTNLTSTVLNGGQFPSATFIKNKMISTDFENADFVGATLTKPNLENANLAGSIFYKANLISANFTGAILTKTNFIDANLSSSVFTKANLTSANLSNANLSHSIFFKTNMTKTTLDNCNLKQGDLSKTILISSSLRRCDLIGTTFYDAQLNNSDFSQANLITTSLRNSNLSDTNFTDATLISVDFSATYTDSNQTKVSLQSVLKSAKDVGGIIIQDIKSIEDIKPDRVYFTDENLTACEKYLTIKLEDSDIKLKVTKRKMKYLIKGINKYHSHEGEPTAKCPEVNSEKLSQMLQSALNTECSFLEVFLKKQPQYRKNYKQTINDCQKDYTKKPKGLK